ncbi:Flagellin [Pandoraea cepalis]|uniref:Flagellin n=1 Tax=Pandoraea cepalis TaxID=2508294 RepID=A0A5E4XHC3_9BURK|nr:flagellin [Pandoraea cepalis]VVE35774.1 Flagellin [Pandoraea cepalis]
MSSVINTNIFSLVAQRNLSTSQSSLQTSITRLSSGLRINSAADDAAGLAITDRMSSQINGLTQAQRNANDGISLVQTAAGALSSITDNLQRIRTLAVQATNTTNSDSDRAALDQEVQQRLAEINRTAQQTQFNGLSVLNGSMGTANFQVGANAGQTISVNLSQSMGINSIGSVASASSTAALTKGAPFVADATTNTISVTAGGGTGGAVKVAAGTYSTAAQLAAAINAAATTSNGSAITVATVTATGELSIAGDGTNSTVIATAGTANNLGITSSTSATVASTSTKVANTLTGAITLAAGDLTITGANGTATQITGTFNTPTDLANAISATNTGVTGYIDSTGKLNLLSHSAFTIAGSAGGLTATGLTAAAAANGGVQAVNANSTLSSANVTSIDNATKMIAQIDSAISTVDTLNATLGAVQNRFQSAIGSLSTSTQNLTSARSGVQDTDYAAETANLTRSQILQQAGISMLSQANQLPQQVLKLLQ